MATSNSKLESLGSSQEETLSQLESSSTALGGQQLPTMRDVTNQQRLLKTTALVQKIKDEELQKRWYGDKKETVQTEGGQTGLIGKTLDGLARPLYGIVGAVDYATGKSGASSLGQAVNQNMKTSKRTFGNVLKDSGAPGIISAPLGFALDVAFDPVNWITAGTTALIPKVFVGAAKGFSKGGIAQGLKAGVKGFESGMLDTALTARNLGRVATGKILKETPESGKMVKALGSLGKSLEQRALSSSDQYSALTGINAIDKLAKAGIPVVESKYRATLGELAREVASRNPVTQAFFSKFDYNNAEWTRVAKIKDLLTKTAGSEEEMKAGVKAFIKAKENNIPYEEAFKMAKAESGMIERKVAATVNPTSWDDASTPIQKALFDLPNGPKISEDINLLKELVENPKTFISSDPVENAVRMLEKDTLEEMNLEDLKKIIQESSDETGIEWYDKTRRAVFGLKQEVKFGKRSATVGDLMQKASDSYAAFIAVFKRAAVGGSPTAWTNAIVGNPTMAWMGGVNILDPLYLHNIKKTEKILRGARGSDILLNELFASKEFLKTLDNYPGFFKQTTGLSEGFLRTKHNLEQIIRSGRDAGLNVDDISVEDLAKATGYAMDEVSSVLDDAAKFVKESKGTTLKSAERFGAVTDTVKQMKSEVPSDSVKKALKKGKPMSPTDMPTGMMANEFFDSTSANKAFEFIHQKAQEGSRVHQLLDFAFNKMASGYERIDQTYKFGTMRYLMEAGITEKEMHIISRNLRLEPKDFTKVVSDGKYRYQMSGEKALEFVNDVYLNYAAMPAAVKMMRRIPFLSSPFISFSYGMMTKTLNTLASNPAVFNKVSFALNDFSSPKTPLDKATLTNPMFSYLNEPTMVKLPIPGENSFFAKNALYLNVANILPYYSLNMFTPTERRYSDLYSNNVVGIIDKSPFMKDPIMTTIFDNFIQPMIIKESRPLGSFGQPLYPTDASITERAKSALYQGVIDPVTPGVFSVPAGLATGALAPGMANYVPTYRGRKTAQAVQGKTGIGKTSKEPVISNTIRAILGGMGVPVQSPVSLNYLPEDLSEKLKQK